jgi:hypothetical protein
VTELLDQFDIEDVRLRLVAVGRDMWAANEPEMVVSPKPLADLGLNVALDPDPLALGAGPEMGNQAVERHHCQLRT